MVGAKNAIFAFADSKIHIPIAERTAEVWRKNGKGCKGEMMRK
jgi:hypothetical protein